jgi:hypothetical protein
MTGVSIISGGDMGGNEVDLPISGASFVLLNQATHSIGQNYVAGGDGTITGTPTPQSTYTTFVGESSYVDTTVFETNDMTVFAVVKSTATGVATATSAYYTGTYGANNKIGVGMWQSGTNGTSISFGAQHGGSSVVAGFAHTHATPALMCGRCNTTTTTLKNHTNGLVATATTATARNINNAKMRVGSAYKDFAASADVYMAIFFTRYLTDAECTVMAEWVRKYYSFDGITI